MRWPGGCFADDYHWRKGIGRVRQAQMNPDWGGVIEPNTFGTHSHGLIEQIGSGLIAVKSRIREPQEDAGGRYITPPSQRRCRRSGR